LKSGRVFGLARFLAESDDDLAADIMKLSMRALKIRGVAILVSIAMAAATQLSAQSDHEKVTIGQLEQLLAADHGKSDFAVGEELSGLVLTERASALRQARWQQDFRGPHAREALMVLSDAAAFLNLPAADQPPLPAPDFKTQGGIMGRAIDYVSKTIPRLPNFLATRETTQIEDVAEHPQPTGTPSFLRGVQDGSAEAAGLNTELHVVRHFNLEVAYRDGKEVADTESVKTLQASTTGLATKGEFGPILGLVLSDAIRGSIHWGHWEQGATGAEAVFLYKVPARQSHYQVAFSFGEKVQQLTPAYHGEMAIDPTTGSILRLTVVADLDSPYRQVEAAILVEFGPVEIGAHSYICPLKAVAISRLPLSTDAAEAQMPSTPRRTEINDVVFAQYHVFRSASRILTEEEAKHLQDPTPPVAAPAAVPDPGASVQAPAAQSTPAGSASAIGAVAVASPPAAPAQAVRTASLPPLAVAPAQSSPAANEAPPPPEARTTVLHTGVSLVLLDVVVTDHNRPVRGLDQKRFHVFENGREHTISTFSEHAAAPLVRVAPANLPPHTYSNVPTFSEGSAVNVLLIDGLNTPTLNQNDVRRQMIKYLEKLPSGTTLAIFTLSSRLRMVQGFTADTTQLLDALRKYSIGAHPGERLANDSESFVASDPSMSGVDSSTVIRMMQFTADSKVQDIDQRVHLTMDGLQQLARYLSAVPGRKNLIWFSGSFPLALGPTDDIAFRAQADPLKDQRSYEVEVRYTADLLATARVAVYPIDARGVVETTAFSAGPSSTPTSVPGPSGAMINAHSVPTNETSFAHKSMAEGDSMTELADETGGHAYLNDNDLQASIANIVENGSSYYTIGYVPSGKLDGKFRNLRVVVDGAHYSLSYRKGYFADDPAHPSDAAKIVSRAHSPLLAATLPGAPPATQILFQARVLPVTDPLFAGKHLDSGAAGEMTPTITGPLKRYVAEVTVDPSTITFSEQPGGSRRAELEFALVGYDASTRRVNYVERSVQLDFNAAQFADVTAKGLRVRLALDLPSAPETLRIAVFDSATVRTGSLEVPIAPGQ
jgi:VWFA-related protein